MIALHLKAPSDLSGNPRRVWVVINWAGEVKGIHDEGYNVEFSDLKKKYPSITQGPSIDVSCTEYRNWIRRGTPSAPQPKRKVPAKTRALTGNIKASQL